MPHTPAEPAKQRRARRRTERVLAVAAAALATGLIATGCGASSPTRSSTGQPQAASQAIAYSRCMRSHGVPGFPDPTISRSGGGVGIGLGIPASMSSSPAFKTAQQACAKLVPGGAGEGGAAPVTAQQHRQIVQFAACMRSNGVPGFPDPDATGTFHLVGINTNAPAFTTATHKCQVNGLPLSISSQPS